MAYLGAQLGGDVQAILSQQWVRTAITYGAWAFANFTWSPPPVYVAGVPVSVRSQESYTYKAEATKHAIEDGSAFSDHVILEPLRVDIVAEVGNWYPELPGYSLQLLEKLWRERKQITLLTKHKVVPNMVLVSLRADNEVPHWGRLMLEMSFQEIPTVKIETKKYTEEATTGTEGKTSSPSVPKSAADSTNIGHVQTAEYDPGTELNSVDTGSISESGYGGMGMGFWK